MLSNSTKQRILTHYTATPEGRHKLAASMVYPFNTRLGYWALWRRTLTQTEIPFCEPTTYEVSFEVNPANPDTLERGQDRARNIIQAQVEQRLIELVTPPDSETNESQTHQNILDDYKSFAQQQGTILLNGRTLADFRKHCPSLEPLAATPTLTTEVPTVHENMMFWPSIHIEPGNVLFVPRSAGRYADTLAVTLDEGPGGLPLFKVTFKVCLEADHTKVQAVRLFGTPKHVATPWTNKRMVGYIRP